jgi:exosortase A-associated hydrolase 2
MSQLSPGAPHAEPFFFDAAPGTRFCLYHAAAPGVPPRGGILYLHPLGDEMNRARRAAATQARAFAAAGYTVLQFDLFGCGDSCGDFHNARWELWRTDVAALLQWLAARAGGRVFLWGLRLGALLALDVAHRIPVAGLILWQPFARGRTCLNQFLRGGVPILAPSTALPHTTTALRAHLYGHGAIEVGGYELAADLARALDACDAAELRPQAPVVLWLATGSPVASTAAATALRLEQRWAGARIVFHHIPGPPFWAAPEPVEVAPLIAATTRSCNEVLA